MTEEMEKKERIAIEDGENPPIIHEEVIQKVIPVHRNIRKLKKNDEVIDKRKVFEPVTLKLSKLEKLEIEKKIEKYLKLKIQARLCTELENELHELFTGVKKVKIGKYLIEGSAKERNMKAQQAKITNYWDWNIEIKE